MKKIVCLFALIIVSLLASTSVKAICQGTYKTSRTWQVGGIVYSHAETQIPFCSQIYYTNPAVESTFTEGATVLATGFNEGNASNYTEAKVDMGYYTPAAGQTYCTYGNHYLVSYYQVYVDYWGGGYYWYDPWQLGFSGTSGGYDGPGLFGFGNSSYWESSVLYIGTTSACATYTGQTQCPVGQQFTPTGINCNSEPEPPKPLVKIQSVGFKDDYRIMRISDDSIIDNEDNEPTWVRGRVDNDKYPVAYVKGSQAKLFGTFSVENVVPNYTTATIRLKVDGVVKATISNVNVGANGTVSFNNVTVNLPKSTPTRMTKYDFKWEMSNDGVNNWTDIGTSGEHTIHWLYATPNLINYPVKENPYQRTLKTDIIREYPDLYDIALENSTAILGDGSDNPSDNYEIIAQKITEHLGQESVVPYDPNTEPVENNPLLVFNSSDKKRQCSDKATILLALLRSIGITNGKLEFYLGGDKASNRPNAFVQPGVPIPTTPLPDGYVTARFDRPAHGTAAKAPYFQLHATVVFPNGKSFDPSYGIVDQNGINFIEVVDSAGICLKGDAAKHPLWKIVSDHGIFYRSEFNNLGTACGIVPRPAKTSALINQSVPSDMQTGQTYPVSITLQNDGSYTWRSSEGYQLGSQSPTNNFTWGLNRVNLPNDVAPGQQVTFSFNITAPTSPGVYNFQWQMIQNGVEWFGEPTPNVPIEVIGQTECSAGDQQACYWQGGYWNSQTCQCEGVY
ncbi:MAG TPA: NBR1-Ig-like domain-containing protein [Pyrinomonadaceae bacterium]|nr:NBR1-Ig-like domain-containing protein [Pyrinomonadaceae bacterium]